MPTGPLSDAVQHLRRAVLRRQDDELTDGQLLECFLACREPAALEVLVRRHAHMVWGVCRRVLRDSHDAEDAFQATFLVLLRRASSVVPRERVGNWLHGVAHRTALKALATAAKRRARDRDAATLPRPTPAEEDHSLEVLPLLDEELTRLPDCYRACVVLCDLEGKSRKEASAQLGLPEGTVASRLARGRAMLARQLTRRGVLPPGQALLAALEAGTAVPPAVMSNLLQSAAQVAAGQAPAGMFSAEVLLLTERVLRAMMLAKLRTVAMVVFVLALSGLVCAALAVGRPEAAEKPAPQAKGEEAKRPAPAQAEEDDHIRPGDRLRIQATELLPDRPIDGVFRVEPRGTVALGAGYRRVQVKGLSLEEAEAKIRTHLAGLVRAAEVSVTRYDPVPATGEEDLEKRVRQLEKEVRNLRATVERLAKQKGR
jgi:RNA polymerase sigma factor (sigma-70 family)